MRKWILIQTEGKKQKMYMKKLWICFAIGEVRPSGLFSAGVCSPHDEMNINFDKRKGKKDVHEKIKIMLTIWESKKRNTKFSVRVCSPHNEKFINNFSTMFYIMENESK